MIRINLRSFRSERKKENIQQQVTIFLLIIAVVGIGLYWYNSRLNGKIEALENQIAYTEGEIVRYKKIAKEVDELKEKLALLKQKLEIIQNLDNSRETAFVTLDTIRRMVVEKRMWFTDFKSIEEKIKKESENKRQKDKKKQKEVVEVVMPKINIEVRGIALDNKTVADFMTRLQNEKLFADVKLVTLQQIVFSQGEGRKGIELKNFHVVCKGLPMNKKKTSENGEKS